MIEEVEYYLNNILKKQLENFVGSNIDKIIDNIRVQMYSLIYHWNDTELKNTILLTGLEEGNFYLPNANNYIRSFVVVTIRNSYIESAGSEFYKTYDFSRQILDSEMKDITSVAIKYFKELDLSSLALKINLDPINDYYLNIIKKYPNSYEVLKILANYNKNEVYFDKITVGSHSNIFINGMNTSGGRNKTTIEDGYTDKIGLDLVKAIQSSKEYGIPFISNSFKFITRNYEKLLRVIQFLLENDMIFVTSNYYISNGYVSRRSKLLRVAHTDKERDISMRNVTGLSKRHAKVINDARKQHLI